MSLQTFRDRWTLFVGALLSIALGVALVQAGAVVIDGAGSPPAGATPAESAELARSFDDVNAIMGMSLFLGLFLSVFIISSTFSFTVTERRRELALLRLSGASRANLMTLLVGEGLVLGVLGSGLGALLGTVVVRGQLWLLGNLDLPADRLDVSFSPWLLVVDLGVGVGVAVAGVALAARRASRVRPLEALRDVGQAARVMTLGRWLWGLGMAVPAVAAAIGSQTSSDMLTSVLLGFAVIFTGSIALQQLSPLIVPGVGAVVGLALRPSVVGDLARSGLRDGVRRTATTAGPLIVLVGLVVGLMGILTSQTAAATVEREQTTKGEIVVESTGASVSRIRSTPGVAVAAATSTLPARILLPRTGRAAQPMKWAEVVAVDPAGYRATTDLAPKTGRLSDFSDHAAVLGPGAAVSISPKQSAVVMQVGSVTRRLPVVAHLPETVGPGPDVIVPRAVVPSAVLAKAPTQTVVRVAAGTSVATVRDRLRASHVGMVRDLHSWSAEQSRQQGDENVSVMGALAGLGGVYALISVINAVAVGVSQRKRELAVARVTGFSRAQVVLAAVVESLVVTAIGLLLGGVVAATCLMGVRRGNESALGVPVLDVPWMLVIGLGVGSVLVVAATSAVAGWSSTRPRPVSLVAGRE
ncbi:ABC transporter permease [Luteipulveratus mongoliensis]|nr:FtsX-like permease family protein [Luteipulveratus mongoliensis]